MPTTAVCLKALGRCDKRNNCKKTKTEKSSQPANSRSAFMFKQRCAQPALKLSPVGAQPERQRPRNSPRWPMPFSMRFRTLYNNKYSLPKISQPKPNNGIIIKGRRKRRAVLLITRQRANSCKPPANPRSQHRKPYAPAHSEREH